jgi:hypothetical protein
MAGFILSFFPLLWIISDYAVTGKFLGFVGTVTSHYEPKNTFENLSNNPISQFFIVNFVSLNIVGLITFIHLIRHDVRIKKFSWVFFISIAFMSFLAFFGKAMPTHNYWRISSSWSLLVLPFTAYLLSLFLKTKFSKRNLNILSFTVVASILIIFFLRQDLNYASHSYFTKSDLKTGEYLNQLILKDKLITKNRERFLIVSFNCRCINVVISSQHPNYFEYVSKPLIKNDYISIKKNMQFNILNLKQDSIKYVILPDYLIDLKIYNVRLLLIDTIGDWNIYEIQYDS